MANLEGMPIGSLPEATSIQDEDELVLYRPSTGKAYQISAETAQDIETEAAERKAADAELEEKIQTNSNLIESGILMTKEFTADNITVTPTGIYMLSTSASVDGYNSIGIIDWYIGNATNSGSLCSNCHCYWCNIADDAIDFRIYNTNGSVSATVRVIVTVLYVKS